MANKFLRVDYDNQTNAPKQQETLPAGSIRFFKCRGCGVGGIGIDVPGVGPMHVACDLKRLDDLRKKETTKIEVDPETLQFVRRDCHPLPPFRDHAAEEKVTFASGASMSKIDERYDLICPTGLRRLAKRYALGVPKHGEFNWCEAGEDKAFQRARLNHLIRHLAYYLKIGNENDDNLAAIAWGAFALMHYEEKCSHHTKNLP